MLLLQLRAVAVVIATYPSSSMEYSSIFISAPQATTTSICGFDCRLVAGSTSIADSWQAAETSVAGFDLRAAATLIVGSWQALRGSVEWSEIGVAATPQCFAGGCRFGEECTVAATACIFGGESATQLQRRLM